MTHKSRLAGAVLAPTFALALMAVVGAGGASAKRCTSCTTDPASALAAACGTDTPSLGDQVAIEVALAEIEPPAPALITIPVYFHIVTDDAGTGDVSDTVLNSQIAIMNTAFAGGQGSGAANTNYRFTLAGIDRTANTAWYTAGVNTADEVAMKTALHEGSADDLNIYVKLSDVGGYSTFPWGYAAKPLEDGIVSPAAPIPGDGMAHEVGHWLGLYHTFQGGCNTSNDYVSDTPAEATPNRACPAPANLDTCTGGKFKGKDPTNNFMDYTPDACRDRFTAGQSSRMDVMYNAHRAGK